MNCINTSDAIVKGSYIQLGDGYELRPIQKVNKNGKIVNDKKYCNIYCNGVKLSNKIFSKSRFSSTFKDGYCVLHWYDYDKFNCDVLINKNGNIVLMNDSPLLSDYDDRSIYHIHGHLVLLNGDLYDLRNIQLLVKCVGFFICGKNGLIFEHRFSTFNKYLPFGIYLINYWDCTLKKIDDICELMNFIPKKGK